MQVLKPSLAALAIVTALLATPSTLSAVDKSQTEAPTSWGMLSGNTSCVIFAEGRKTSGHFYGIAVTTRTVGKLTVLEQQNYDLPDKQVLETQDNMDHLMQLSEKDHVKFVKIPEKHTPEQLDQARAACKATAQ